MSVSGIQGNKQHGDRANSGKGKFQAVNINSQFSGKSLVSQKSGPAKHGLQSLGKQSAVARRMPPPANLPSLRAESAGQDPNVNLVPSGGPGWGNQEPPTSSSDTQNAVAGRTLPATQQNYQKGAQSVSTGPGGGGPGGVVQPAVGGTIRSEQQQKTSWNANRIGGGDGENFFAQSSRDFPTLSAAGDSTSKATAETGGPSLRPQKFGSWKSGGGGGVSKGGGEDAQTQSAVSSNGAQEEISPAPSPGAPSMDHPPHHHYLPQGPPPYPQRMYPGGGYHPPGMVLPPGRGYPPLPFGGPGGVYPYPPPRPPVGGQYPHRPMQFGSGHRPPHPGQQHQALYDERYGPAGPYGPPHQIPSHRGRDYLPRDGPHPPYPPQHHIDHRENYLARGGRGGPVRNGNVRDKFGMGRSRDYEDRENRRVGQGDYTEGYYDNDHVVWSDEEGPMERDARTFEYWGAHVEHEAWSDTEEPYENRRPSSRDYEYGRRGRPTVQQMPPQRSRMGYPTRAQADRGYRPPPPDWYPPHGGVGYPPVERRTRAIYDEKDAADQISRDTRDIEDEEAEERRRQIQQNAEREAAIERSRQRRRLGPQVSTTSSTGASSETPGSDFVGGRQRLDSGGELEKSDGDLERPSSREDPSKAGVQSHGRGHGPVPPRFQRHTDFPLQVGARGPYRGNSYGNQGRPKSQEACNDSYAEYYGSYDRNDHNSSSYYRERPGQREYTMEEEWRDREMENYHHHVDSGGWRDIDRSRFVPDNKDKLNRADHRCEEKLKKFESKESVGSGSGQSSEKSYEKTERGGDKQGKQKNYSIEAPPHPATVREEDMRTTTIVHNDEEEDSQQMQVLSKPANVKVIKRTAGSNSAGAASKKSDAKSAKGGGTGEKAQAKSSDQRSQMANETSPFDMKAESYSEQSSSVSKEKAEVSAAPPAKNVWEQRKEERESQEKEAKRAVGQSVNAYEMDEQRRFGYGTNKRSAGEDVYQGSRGGGPGGRSGMRSGRPTREFISQSRRLRGASTGGPRSSRGRGFMGGGRRGASVPTGPASSRRNRYYEEQQEDHKTEKEGGRLEEEKEEIDEKGPAEKQKDDETKETTEGKDQKTGSTRGQGVDNRGPGRPRTSNRPRTFPGMAYGPTMMRHYYFPFMTPSPFATRGMRGGRGTSFSNSRGRGSSFSSRGRSQRRGGPPGGSLPPDRGKREKDEDEDEEEDGLDKDAQGSCSSGQKGSLSPRYRASRGGKRSQGSRNKHESATQAKSPTQSEGQDEWETASESSDVGERSKKKDSSGKRSGSGAPQRFSAQRRVERGGSRMQQGNSSSVSQRPGSSGAGQVTWGPGSGPNRGKNQQGKGAVHGQSEHTEPKNVRAASHQGNQANTTRRSDQKQSGSHDNSHQSNAFKPDALAGVDINNIAGVVIIDNQPDVVFDPHLDGFQEVVSRKEKRLRKEQQQQNDLLEKKSGSSVRAGHRGHGRIYGFKDSGFASSAGSKKVGDKDKSTGSQQKFSQKSTRDSSFGTFNAAETVDALTDVGTWENSMNTVGTVELKKSEEEQQQKHLLMGEEKSLKIDFAVSSSGFDSVIFNTLPSKTGVEIWGTPDPVPFEISGQENCTVEKEMERPAPAKSVEFPADMTLGPGKETESDKFDFTFDPNLPAVTGDEVFGHSSSKAVKKSQQQPPPPPVSSSSVTGDLTRSDVQLTEKLISVRGVWDEQQHSSVGDDTAAIVSSAASMMSAALYKQQNQNQVDATQQNLQSSVGKSSLAEGPNVAKVRPQQQQGDFLSEGAGGMKLSNLNLVHLDQSQCSAANDGGMCSTITMVEHRSVSSPPLLTPPAASGSFFANPLVPSIRNQFQSQPHVDFSQPPPSLSTFQPLPQQQVPGMAQQSSMWPQVPSLGNMAQLFSASDVMGSIRPQNSAGFPAGNSTNAQMFIATSVGHPPAPIQSPPNFLANQLSKGMSHTPGTNPALFGQPSGPPAFIVQEPPLLNMSQPPPPVFGAVGSQRGQGTLAGSQSSQSPSQSSFLVSANAFGGGGPPAAASLLGPPPSQPPKMGQQTSLSPFGLVSKPPHFGLGTLQNSQPAAFSPVVAKPSMAAPTQQLQLLPTVANSRSVALASLVGLPPRPSSQPSPAFSGLQKVAPRPGQSYQHGGNAGRRQQQNSTPPSTTSVASEGVSGGYDVNKGRDGDLLQRIDDFLKFAPEEEDGQSKNSQQQKLESVEQKME